MRASVSEGLCARVRVLATVAAVSGCVAGVLAAQGTNGKIEGTVKDPSGAPIAGAQVLIVGSAFQVTTDDRGYYFLNNVPAGVVTVRAQYIGYTPNEVRDVRVLAGQTMTVNPVLQQRALELGAITVTTQQNPIVPRDQVSSKPTVQGDLVARLPVDRVSQVLALQPGVVQGSRGLSIRGSRPGTQATYIDGVLVRNFDGGFGNAAGSLSTGYASAIAVGTNALEEASITTGAVGAQYGQAEGGVINEVTRAGGNDYHGSISYQTDNAGGPAYSTGLNRVEASVGGPIVKDFTFYMATTLQGQQNDQRPLGAAGIPQFVLGGTADSLMVPLDPGSPTSDSQLVRLPQFVQYASGCAGGTPSVPYSTGGDLSGNPRTLPAALKGGCRSSRLLDANRDQAGFDGKLQYTFGLGSQLALTYHLDRNQGLNGYPTYDPVQQTGFRSLSQDITGNWSQTLSATSGHELALQAALSWQRDQHVDGLVQPGWLAGHQNPFAFFNASNIQFVNDFNSFPVNGRLIQALRLGDCKGTIRCVPFLDRSDLVGASAYRVNPYGVSSTAFDSRGGVFNSQVVSTLDLLQETRLTGRANLDWQANRYNRVQGGVDFTSFKDLAYGSQENVQAFQSAFIDSPNVYGLYGQDRIDLGDVVIELGLRYDRMNTGIQYPRIPGRAYSDPIKSANYTEATKLQTMAFNAQDSSMVRSCDAALAAADSAALSTCNFFKAAPQDALSPTLRVSFPVTDRTGFRLSYSHQVETPDMGVLARGTNSDLAVTNTNDIFARPVGFGKTIMFEFGVRHAFSDDMVLDISAYNKDLVAEGAGRTLNIYDPVIGGNPSQTNEAVNLFTSADFGNARGIDFRLDRRFGSIFQGTISYTYQTAKNTGSDPQQYLNTLARTNSAVTGARVPPPQAILTSADNRTHTIAGNLAATFPAGWHGGTVLGSILENAGVYATFSFASGLPYTLMENGGLGGLGPNNGFGLSGTPLEPINSSTMPWVKDVDLRLTKGLRLAGRDLMVFAQFQNLFDWKNLTSIFAETGDVVNQLYQANQIAPQLSAIQNDAGRLWVTRQVVVDGVTQTRTGVDLTDCSLYPYGAGGTNGAPDCLMLRQAEARWGNGDNFFDTNEIDNAYTAWYNRAHGPYTLYGNGLNVRLGFEFTF